MGNTRLRIPEGLEITKELLANLEQRVGDFTLEHYSESPNLNLSYQRRIEVLKKDFLFILDTIPMKPGTDLGVLKDFVLSCQKASALPHDETIEVYQESLSQYAALLIGALVDHCEWPDSLDEKKLKKEHKQKKEEIISEKKKLATELLNKADEYIVMQEGRDDLATIVPINVQSVGDLVLLWDTKLPPCIDETLDEFRAIKNSPLLTAPAWFSSLSDYQRLYFYSVNHTDNTVETVQFELNNLILKWKKIKEAYPTKTLEHDLRLIAKGKGNLPAWYTDLPANYQLGIKLASFSKITIKQFDARLDGLVTKLGHVSGDFSENLTQLKRLPYWFLALSSYEQRFLKETLNLKRFPRVEDAISFIPSRLRTLPGLANFGEHSLQILDSDGQLIKEFEPKLRYSHPCSRDVLDQPNQVIDLHSQRNLQRISECSEGKFLLVQTLISPEWVTSTIMPDYALDLQRKMAVAWAKRKLGIQIISTNHPYNLARIIDYTTADNPDCLEILKLAEAFSLLDKLPELKTGWQEWQIKDVVEQAFIEFETGKPLDKEIIEGKEAAEIKASLIAFFNTNHEQLKSWPNWQKAFVKHLHFVSQKAVHEESYLAYKASQKELAELASEYKAVLNSGFGTSSFLDYNGRELVLSTLEDLIFPRAGGKSSGSCVSGKDREWIRISHSDAFEIYRAIYGTWPSFSDKGTARANFVNLVALIYVSRHGHAHAEQNAPGCDGIKTPDTYWPKDIAKAIKKRLKNPRALEIDDILATNNEVSRIGNVMTQIQVDFSSFVFSALKLSSSSQQKVLTLIKAIVEEKRHWHNEKQYNLSFYKASPDGIEEIDALIDKASKQKYQNNSITLAGVYKIVDKRPETSSKRADTTQAFYDCIKDLCKAPEPEKCLDSVLEKLNDIKKVAYGSNTQLLV